MPCRNFVLAVVLASSSTTVALAADEKYKPVSCAAVDSVGVAHMAADGVITLRIRSLPPGPIAEGEFRYAPDDPHYKEIKQHVGGIAPGGVKLVPPWC
jgi:hypothetical protein